MCRGSAAALFSVLLFGSAPIIAGPWHTRADFEVLTDYSGNVFLDAAQQTEELVVRARPLLDINRAGSRGKASVLYVPEFRYFTRGTQSNTVIHYLSATADMILVERMLGLKGSATAGENVINTNFGYTQDSISNPDNVTNTYTLRVSPYLIPIRLGRYASFAATTDLDIVDYSDTQVENSSGSSIDVNLTSGPAFSPFDWRLSARTSLVSYENGQNTAQDEYSLAAGYRIDRSWRLGIVYGSDVVEAADKTAIDEPRWALGLSWTPHSRAGVQLSFGERFGDPEYGFELNYKHKKSCWYGKYGKELTSSRASLVAGGGFKPGARLCSVRENLTTAVGQTGLVVAGPGLNTRESISERFSIGFNWMHRRTQVDIGAQYEKRDFLGADGNSTDTALYVSLERNLTPRSLVSIAILWLDHAQPSLDLLDPLDYEQYSAALNYRYNLSRSTNLVLGYRLTVRDGGAVNDYSEDRLTFSLVSNYQ